MPDPEMTAATGGAKSPEGRRAQQAAKNVATWERAFAAAKAQAEGEPDRANAGALVSRAHREEKTSGGSPHAVGPDDRAAGGAE
jgi:hypothetical protein